MAVNNNGVLGMIMVERRLDVRDSCLEQLFAASFDGGDTFGPFERLSVSSCGGSTIDAVAIRMEPTYGDYFGMVTLPDSSFRIVWPEMRQGASALVTAVIGVDGVARTPSAKQ